MTVRIIASALDIGGGKLLAFAVLNDADNNNESNEDHAVNPVKRKL